MERDFPKIKALRFHGSGMGEFPVAGASHGNSQMLARAILHEDSFPIKALIGNRFEPLQSIPAATNTRKALDKLDLILTIDLNFSELAGIPSYFAGIHLPGMA